MTLKMTNNVCKVRGILGIPISDRMTDRVVYSCIPHSLYIEHKNAAITDEQIADRRRIFLCN